MVDTQISNEANPDLLDFRKLFESVPGLYLVISPALNIIAASDGYLEATKTKRDIIGKHLFEVFPNNPDDPTADGVQNLHASLQRVLQTGLPDTMAVQKYDIRNPESEGGGFEIRYWSPLNRPVFNDKKEIIYIIHRAEDVTDFLQLKQSRVAQEKLTKELKDHVQNAEIEIYARAQEIQVMNQQLVDSNLELAKKEKQLSDARDILQNELASGQNDLLALANELALRKQELQKTMEEMRAAKDEALRASQVKSQFLANMSHEIRTPLGIILGFTDLLRDQSLSRVQLDAFITRIRHSGEHLLDLLSEILDLTKIEAGHLDIDYSDVSVTKLLEEIESVLEPGAQQKGLQLKINQFSGVPKTIRTDHTKVRQILINLISNAIKFSEKGTIELTASMNPSIQNPKIQFTVKDSGPGISSSYQRKLFEEFSQADISMTRKHGGSGLGLALSKKLAVALGGNLELLETNSTGSTFLLQIPVMIPENVIPFPGKKTNDLVHLNDVKILLVDDVPDNLFLASLLLKKAGAKVETAVNGEEAVEKAMAGEFDLVLMDVQMPKLNGYEATSKLRSQGYNKPIVALTAHAMKEDREKCMQSGCNDYLAKPIVGPILMQTVQKNLVPPNLGFLH